MPDGINPPGIRFWRRPTLARPIAVLPSGLQRFTAVFGMGTGGTTALLSPEARAGPGSFGASHRETDADLWRRRPPRRTPYNFTFKRTRFQIINLRSEIRNLFW